MKHLQKESLQFELILTEVRKIRKLQPKYGTLKVFKELQNFFLENNIKMEETGSLSFCDGTIYW